MRENSEMTLITLFISRKSQTLFPNRISLPLLCSKPQSTTCDGWKQRCVIIIEGAVTVERGCEWLLTLSGAQGATVVVGWEARFRRWYRANRCLRGWWKRTGRCVSVRVWLGGDLGRALFHGAVFDFTVAADPRLSAKAWLEAVSLCTELFGENFNKFLSSFCFRFLAWQVWNWIWKKVWLWVVFTMTVVAVELNAGNANPSPVACGSDVAIKLDFDLN